MPIFSIIAYFIFAFSNLEYIILAIKEIKGNYKGENLTLIVLKVIYK